MICFLLPVGGPVSNTGKCCMPLFLTQVTRSVSMPTTSPSAGLLGTPSHSRTWFLLAASEPVSGRRCSSVLRSLMVRWSTPPCSGPACSELQRHMGCGCVFGKSLLDGSKFISAWEARTSSYLSLRLVFDSRFINTTSFLRPFLFQSTIGCVVL